MTGLEILHGVLDAALTGGVLFALHGRHGRRARAANPRVAGVEAGKPVEQVELWKGEHRIGVRPEGHPDIKEALKTEGLWVRWPDGSIQDHE